MARFKYPLAGIAVVIILLGVYYGSFVKQVDTLCFAPWGDGYKNYYTLAYYIQNDSGAHFTGMNYPYGENIIYTDNQPLVAVLHKQLNHYIPSIAHHLRAIILYAMLLSVVLSFLILYRILRRFELPEWYACIFAILICMLAPQLARLNGHFSLAYSFFLPALILLVTEWLRNNRSVLVLIGITALLTAFVFIHPYYFAIAALFLASLFVAHTFTYRSLSSYRLLIPVVVSFAVFKLFLLLTDHISNRPGTPWGFIMSRSTVADILLHPNSFIFQGLSSVISTGKIVFHWEGQAYLGVVTLMGLLLFLFFKFRKHPVSKLIPPAAVLLFVASVPVLLFAMAFPFSLHPSLERLIDYIPGSLKQFRAAGRFSWVFYYTSAVLGALVLYRTLHLIQNKFYHIGLATAIVLLWFIDVNTINNYHAREMKRWSATANESEEARAIEQQLNNHHLSFDSFQAILPAPYFNNGSEKIYLEASGSAFEGMKWSLGSGLPLAATMMSRTSVSQSLSLVNLFSSDYIQKRVIARLPSAKPFLLIKTGDVSMNEQQVIDRSSYLFNAYGTSFYLLRPSALHDSIAALQQQINTLTTGLYNHGTYFSSDSVPNVYLKSYEEQKNDYAVLGKGAYYHEKGDEFLYTDTLPNATDSTWYELSVWMYTDMRTPAYPALYITVNDTQGNATYTTDLPGKFSTENYRHWIKVTTRFPITDAKSKLYVSISGNYRTIDEFMIKPINSTVITHLNNVYLYNNYPLSYSRQ
jgi:hypothetical protein